MIFSHVKISSLRAKGHQVFHWCLYNKVFLRACLFVLFGFLVTVIFIFTI